MPGDGAGYPVPYGPPVRRPHASPGLRVLGIVQLVFCTAGVLAWLFLGFLAAFCGDGVPHDTACHHERVQWRIPALALALAGTSAVATLVRARSARTRGERLALVAAALLTLAAAVAALVWYLHLIARTG